MQAGSPASTTDRGADDQSSAPGAPRKRKKKPPARRTNAEGSTATKSDTRTQRTQNTSDPAPNAAEPADSAKTTPAEPPAGAVKAKPTTGKPQQQKRTARQKTTAKRERPSNKPTTPDDVATSGQGQSTKPRAAAQPTGSAQQPVAKQRTAAKQDAATTQTVAAKQDPAPKRTRKVTAKKKPESQTETVAPVKTQRAKPTPKAKPSGSGKTTKTSAAVSSGNAVSKGAADATSESSPVLAAARTTTATAAGAVTTERTETAPNESKTKRRAGTRKGSEAAATTDLPDALPFVDGDATTSQKQQAAFAEQLSSVDDAAFSDRRVVPSSSHRVRLTSSNRRDQRPVLLVVALFTQLQLTLLALVAMVTGALHAIANVEDGVLNSLSIPERVASLTARADFGLTILLVSVAVSSFIVLALWVHQLRSPDRYEVDWLTPALPGIAVWVVAAVAYLYLKLEIMGVDSEHWLVGEGVIGGLLPYLILTIGALIGAISASQVRDPV